VNRVKDGTNKAGKDDVNRVKDGTNKAGKDDVNRVKDRTNKAGRVDVSRIMRIMQKLTEPRGRQGHGMESLETEAIQMEQRQHGDSRRQPEKKRERETMMAYDSPMAKAINKSGQADKLMEAPRKEPAQVVKFTKRARE
jgi:hypothetical protein